MKKPDLSPKASAPVAGKATPAPAKPSNKAPAVIKAQAKPMAKPAPAKPAVKVKDAKAVTPYGKSI
jgi:hypothetical protein